MKGGIWISTFDLDERIMDVNAHGETGGGRCSREGRDTESV